MNGSAASAPVPSRTPKPNHRSPVWFAHLAAASFLVLYCTDADAVFGMLAGFPELRLATIFIGFCLLAYLCLLLPLVRSLFRQRLFAWWMTLLCLVPSATILLQLLAAQYDIGPAIYWLALVIVNGIIFATAAVLPYQKHGDRWFSFVVAGALAVSALGFFVQYINYSFLRSVMVYSSNVLALSTSTVRLVGFYSHPNYAAFALVCLTALFVMIARRGLTLSLGAIFAFSLLTLAVLLTGSRTSLALTVFAILCYLTITFRMGTTARQLGVTLTAVVVAAAFAAMVLPLVQGSDGALATGLDRLARLLAQFSSPDVSDESASIRASIIAPYLELSYRSPLLGYGHQWLEEHIGSVELPFVSQNSWIQWVVEYGYPYSIAAALLFFATLHVFYRYCGDRGDHFRFASILFMLIVLLATFSINDIFLNKTVLILFGMLLGRFVRVAANAQGRGLGDFQFAGRHRGGAPVEAT